MSSTPKGQLGLTTHRIHGIRAHKANLPEALAESYRILAQATASPNTQALSEVLFVEALIDAGKYTEALLSLDAAMAKSPDNLRLELCYGEMINHAARQVDGLGMLQPEAAEFGRAYELLLELGQVTLNMHLAAVYHFALSGKYERALQIAVRLKERAPHYPGLDEATAFALKTQEERS